MSRAGVRRASVAFALATVVCAPAMAQDLTRCSAPHEALSLEHAPALFRERIAQGKPLKIVAIGSSSTSGAGASSRAATYPARLEAELKARLPGLPITVLNKGIGGEEAPQMVARFEADVFEEAPDLVLWQVGSNSVLRDHPTPGETLRQGVERLKDSGAEVILVNPQYAPKILAKPGIEQSVDVITATARDAEVGLFDRFAAMRYWSETEKLPFDQFITADGLHMNDWGYACVARLVANAILDGTQLPPATATATVGAIKR
ncbi:MAG TPA: GDSL-type esterase/lipase family protein [Xanthobacteraceae bacterium]|nr:GDSL-type esterase/lipase family protein [Xanthobacteraceae bacterium]